MAADLPIRLTLIPAVAWIFTRDPRIIQRAAWKCSDREAPDDPLAGDDLSKVEVFFDPKGSIQLLSLNMWNYADLPGTMTVCDNERCSVDQKVSVAEKAITALLQCLNTGAVTATRRHRAGNRVKNPMDDWEDRYLNYSPVEKPTELLVYRNWTRTPDQDWCDVRVSARPHRSRVACIGTDNHAKVWSGVRNGDRPPKRPYVGRLFEQSPAA